jgi:hypothetical protein
VAQAAATLAATIIGLELGLYGDEVVNAVMVVIGVSMIITSVGTPTYAARVEQPEEEERRLGEVILVPTRHPGEELAARLRFAGQIAHSSAGLLVPLVVALPEDGQDLSEARELLAGIDDELHALGFEGDGRLRIDRSLAEGISGAAIESNASLVLLRWPGPQPFTQYFAETLSSEVSKLVECPVATAAVLESPPDRVFLAVSKRDLTPSRVDALRAAVDLASAAASNHQLVVGPAAPELLIKAGMTLPEWVEHKAGESELFAWVEQNSNEHDLIVAVFRRRFGSRIITGLHDFDRSVVTVMASRGSAGSRAIR